MKTFFLIFLKVGLVLLCTGGAIYLTSRAMFGQQILLSMRSDSTVAFFSALIAFLTAFGAFLPFIWTHDKLNKIVSSLPSLLPAIGLVGTFIGIFLGLAEFNPADIDGSLPGLLSGLKVAFTTSILGIIGSLIVKLLSNFHPEIIQDDSLSEADFYRLFENQNRLGMETNRKLEALEAEFRNFSASLGETTIEHLVNAIEKVMNDFNKKVETQFGENFKRFNEGLTKLLEWQENYKDEVQSHLNTVQKTHEIMALHEQTSQALNRLLEDFIAKTQPITELVSKLETQRQSIEGSLSSFTQIAQQANEVIPVLESQITSLTNQMRDEIGTVTEKLQSLDEDMASELEKALNILAANLGALTEQLVKDYQPLMIALRDLVESGKAAKG